MKTNILKYILGLVVLVVMAVGCTKEFDKINTDPNKPKEVPTVNLISTAEKSLTDDIFDEWFSGRQGLLWSQYWAQRNYTEEDRFIIRQNVNNSYFRLIYTDLMDLQQIINIASNPDKAAEINAYYGDAVGQIAVANILQAYVFQLLASTYGDVPYEEAFYGMENPTPAYSTQKTIFLDLFAKLQAAAKYLEASGTQVFTHGDLMYDGDPAKWAKFANSLRLKLAIRLSKATDPQLVEARQTAITEASANVMASNDDNAAIAYLGDGESNAPMYDGFYTARRNDMTPTANFVDLLKGINDTLNAKQNPFEGFVDPRLDIWVPLNKFGEYRGMPYGLVNQNASALRGYVANIYNAQPVYLQADAVVSWMDYSEVCFILSELNGWDQSWYEDGVLASMQRWGVADTTASAYVATLPAANQENVLTQKYIALYMNGYEAWAEYRRTGFPKSIIEVGELTGPLVSGESVTFGPIPLTGNDRIPSRLTYPVQEYTINRANVDAAVTSMGGDTFNTKLIWE
jgi:hypothetical protein